MKLLTTIMMMPINNRIKMVELKKKCKTIVKKHTKAVKKKKVVFLPSLNFIIISLVITVIVLLCMLKNNNFIIIIIVVIALCCFFIIIMFFFNNTIMLASSSSLSRRLGVSNHYPHHRLYTRTHGTRLRCFSSCKVICNEQYCDHTSDFSAICKHYGGEQVIGH